jgi:small subunit ribosomal protein S6
MKYFETLYIVNPNFEQNRLDTIIKDVEENVGKFSKVISQNIWGKKRLAYKIDNQKYGTFVLLNFETDEGSKIVGFESYMKLNTSVLRAQTIRLKSRPVETVYEKPIPLDDENKLKQSIEDEGKIVKTSEDSSANDESTEPVKVEKTNVIDEAEPIAESVDTETEKK